jgi:hypothetical protein
MQVANQAASEIIVDTNFIESNQPFEIFFRQPNVFFGTPGRWNIFTGNILFTKDSTNGDRIVARFDSGKNDLFYYFNDLEQGQYQLSVDMKNSTGIDYTIQTNTGLNQAGPVASTNFLVPATTDWTTYIFVFNNQSKLSGSCEINFLSNWFATDNSPGSEILISKISLTKIA